MMRRSTLYLGSFVVCGIIAAALYGHKLLFSNSSDNDIASTPEGGNSGPEPAPTRQNSEPPNAEEEAVSQEMLVTKVGSLEKFVDGQWKQLGHGDKLIKQDRIRTTSKGISVIATRDGSRIELVDNVEISLESLTKSLAELELHRGRLRADLNEESDLSIRVRSSGATAESSAGAFVVFADGQGTVAVASETAKVLLRAQDETVLVASGQQSVVLPDRGPSDPEKIPQEVMLKVACPERRYQKSSQLVVRGEVSPGSEVMVDNKNVLVRPDGSFEETVKLSNGTNKVMVFARNPSGRTTTQQSPAVIVKNRPPPIEVIDQGQWSTNDAP